MKLGKKTMQNVLIISSGGDAPGMNATIRAVVRTALHEGKRVFGALSGYNGIINNNIIELDARSVGNCIQRGGTILKTARAHQFREKKYRDIAQENLAKYNIDGLIILGGNGSFQGARTLGEEGGPPAVGIPCTIDNDIVGTEYTIGFDTARNTAIELIDKIRDTASSLERNFIIEVMGRSSGFLAVDVGIAGGAEIILIPEQPMSAHQLIEKLENKTRRKLASIIVAAEADKPGGSFELAREIEQISGIHYTVCVLGHTQRGGTPSAMDRTMGSAMGAFAVRALLDGEQNKMVALQQNIITTTDFPAIEHATRYFNDMELLKINDVLCDID
jgi:6-phosphofructokinase 1